MADKPIKLTNSQQKRVAILRASREEFMVNGFVGASMDRIALRANVSKRTVYNHFPSKEVLFDTTTTELWARTKEAATLVYNPAKSLEDQLQQIAHRCWALYQQPEFLDVARVVMAEFIRSPVQATEAMEKLAKQEGGLEAWLAGAVEHKALNIEDIVMASTQFWGMFKAFAFWPKLFHMKNNDEHQQAIIDANIKMFLAMYRA
ncbi:TetR/AcrR family transcriptional regulator [Shewanella baltica]|uniref:TetR/AcrR family transcriptional regulator n=1 Tax=Shewanella baltica TaxID=62322 RepID=UPI00014F8FF1|nr:TetR/AcrR family transcriptional regulator [Shewanella baltica]ABS06468.1 transcriptional regulator, TetR family [Shewanella baltica OS185]